MVISAPKTKQTRLDPNALTAAAGEYIYHVERLTELVAAVDALADSAADCARALLTTAHMLTDGRSPGDSARLCSAVLGVPWSSESIERTLLDAMQLESRREALRMLIEAHRIAGGGECRELH